MKNFTKEQILERIALGCLKKNDEVELLTSAEAEMEDVKLAYVKRNPKLVNDILLVEQPLLLKAFLEAGGVPSEALFSYLIENNKLEELRLCASFLELSETEEIRLLRFAPDIFVEYAGDMMFFGYVAKIIADEYPEVAKEVNLAARFSGQAKERPFAALGELL